MQSFARGREERFGENARARGRQAGCSQNGEKAGFCDARHIQPVRARLFCQSTMGQKAREMAMTPMTMTASPAQFDHCTAGDRARSIVRRFIDKVMGGGTYKVE